MKTLKISLIVFVSFISSMFAHFLFGKIAPTQASPPGYPDKIVAHSIHIVDENNRSRAGIGFDKQKNPVLFVKDENGKIRAYLACTAKGPLFGMDDGRGNTMLFMEASNDGSTSLGLMNRDHHRPRLAMAYSPNQGPSLGLFDEDNVGRAVVSVTRGTPSVTLLNEDKKPAIAMTSKKGKGALLALWNNNHDPGISLGLLNNQPTFFMYRPQRTGLLFNLAGGRPALALMNNGTPVWSATGDIPAAPDMPLTDDLMRELLR